MKFEIREELKALWEMRKEYPVAGYLLLAGLTVSLLLGALEASQGSYVPLVVGLILFLFLALLLIALSHVSGKNQKGFYYILTVIMLSFVCLMFMAWIVIITLAVLCIISIGLLQLECDGQLPPSPPDDDQTELIVPEWRSFEIAGIPEPLACSCMIQDDIQFADQDFPSSITVKNDCNGSSSLTFEHTVQFSVTPSFDMHVFRDLSTREIFFASDIFNEDMFPDAFWTLEAQETIAEAGFEHIDRIETRYAYARLEPGQSARFDFDHSLIDFLQTNEASIEEDRGRNVEVNISSKYLTCNDK